METLQVQMLGSFSMEIRGHRIVDSENRSQKPWLLLAYLLFHRSRVVTQEELLRLCWGSEEIKGDPANALRVVLHRARTMLDKLGILPGRELILRSRDGFQWNDRLPAHIDVEEFAALYAEGKAAADSVRKRECFERAIDLYTGHFLSRNAGENWIKCVSGKLRTMYLEMVLEVLELLSADGQTRRIIDLCRLALEKEPEHEELYRRLMSALLEEGEAEAAVQLYENLRRQLMRDSGRLPEPETSRMYFRILQVTNGSTIPVDLEDDTTEKLYGLTGAKICDFNFFRMFYASAQWLIAQCGVEMYNVLITVREEEGKNLSARMLERVMDHLQRQLCAEMQRGGTITKSAENQLMLIMRADGYEGACTFCEQQVEKFFREHPNTSVRLHYGAWRVGGETT